MFVAITNFTLSSFKWKTAICNQGRPYFCTARAPRCPPGYTWIASIGSSCFKITEIKGSRVGSQTVNAEPSFHKACAQEGTRLASIKTSAEKTALLEWAFGSEFTNDKNVGTIHVYNNIYVYSYIYIYIKIAYLIINFILMFFKLITQRREYWMGMKRSSADKFVLANR